jgi:exosortase
MMSQQLSATNRPPRFFYPLAAALAVGSLLWAYWTTLGDMAQTWARDPQYSHGYLVPLFALGLLWFRRRQLDVAALRPSWWGGPVLLAGITLRLVGAFYGFVWFDQASLVLCLAGLCLTVGGRSAWRWAWPAVVFLLFMVPLPHRVAVAMPGPLQRLATVASTFVLQTLGRPALAEGNVILINDEQINIVEACSGLRMLVIFFALTTAVAFLARRPLWEKAVIVLSAIPIALLANIVRITATGILYEMNVGAVAHAVFHDLAGWLMMPLGLALLGLELKLLSALLLDAAAPGVRPALVGATPAAGPQRPRTRWRPAGGA